MTNISKISQIISQKLSSSSSTTSQKTRWTLKSLASMNNHLSQQPGSNADIPSSSSSSSMKLVGRIKRPTNTIAETLLQDTQIRLAIQFQKCTEILDIVSNYSIVNNNNNSNNKSTNCNLSSQKQNEPIVIKPRIIRAVNQPVKNYNYNSYGSSSSSSSSKENQHIAHESKNRKQQEADAERMQKNIIRDLNNLQILHADTFNLIHHLLPNSMDKPVLKRFSSADQNLIADTFEQIRSRHSSTVETLADIVIGLRTIQNIQQQQQGSGNTRGDDNEEKDITNTKRCSIVDSLLVDQFLRNRLGIQLLCDHYVSLHKGKLGGGISVNSNIVDVVKDAIIEATNMCDANLGISPDVHIVFANEQQYDTYSKNDTLLIRPWVHHALVELLKNAMSSSYQKMENTCSSVSPSTIENISKNEDTTSTIGNPLVIPPEVYIQIHQDDQFITCKVMDQGVGLNKDGMAKAFLFAESSSLKRWDRLDEQQTYAMVRSPLSSLGVGLTLSQMMMQMFGGDVKLENREGGLRIYDEGRGEVVILDHGCTAILSINRDDTVLERD